MNSPMRIWPETRVNMGIQHSDAIIFIVFTRIYTVNDSRPSFSRMALVLRQRITLDLENTTSHPDFVLMQRFKTSEYCALLNFQVKI